MADTLKRLYTGTCPNTETTAYTAPASTKTVLREAVACNKTASAATFTLKVGGMTIIPAKSIPAGDTLFLELFTVLETTETIQITAGTASAIDVRLSGMEVS